MVYLLQLNQIRKNSVSFVGGKASSLGEMIQINVTVPQGFVITTQAFDKFNNRTAPQELQNNILSEFDKLHTDIVAVRSSGVAEDSLSSSFAGQFETYLNVSRESLIESIVKCWKSSSSKMVKDYASVQKVNKNQLDIAVIVQKMVISDTSGVIFTANPINKNTSEVMIEAVYGLGELLVQGMTTPNNFIVDKNSFEVLKSDITDQNTMMIYKDSETKEVPVTNDKTKMAVLSTDQLVELTKLGIKIEEHFGIPQDIEWAYEKGKLYILQSRPITTL